MDTRTVGYKVNSSYFPFWEYHSLYNEWLWAGWPGGQNSSHIRSKVFLFFTAFRSLLGPTQHPNQCTRVCFPGDTLSLSLKLVLRSRIHGYMHHLLHIPSWHST
jgi:hypothetical protein